MKIVIDIDDLAPAIAFHLENEVIMMNPLERL
jgi:hypothetical protein